METQSLDPCGRIIGGCRPERSNFIKISYHSCNLYFIFDSNYSNFNFDNSADNLIRCSQLLNANGSKELVGYGRHYDK